MLTNSIKFCLIIYYIIHILQSTELTYVGSQLKIHVFNPSFQSKFKVKSSSPNTSFKYRVPIENSYWNCEQTVRELQILQSNSLWTQTQTDIKSAKMRRKELSRNYTYLQHRVSSDKYDTMIDIPCWQSQSEVLYQFHNMQWYK